MTESLDNVLLNIRNDDSQVNVRKIRDHYVENAYVGLPLTSLLNSSDATTTNWELVKSSDNLASVPPVSSGQYIFSSGNIPESLAYEDFWVEYRLKDSDSSGSIGKIEDEFDRYKTKFTIDYMYDDNGTMTPGFVEFKAPNSVTKYLMGWNPNDPISYRQYTTLDPIADPQEFVNFFANLENTINNLPANALARSKIINRNTPYPLNDPDNPFEATLALLSGISHGDVLVQDDLYPTQINLEMTNYGN